MARGKPPIANAVAAFHSQDNPVRRFYLQLTCEGPETARQGSVPRVTRLETAGAELGPKGV